MDSSWVIEFLSDLNGTGYLIRLLCIALSLCEKNTHTFLQECIWEMFFRCEYIGAFLLIYKCGAMLVVALICSLNEVETWRRFQD